MILNMHCSSFAVGCDPDAVRPAGAAVQELRPALRGDGDDGVLCAPGLALPDAAAGAGQRAQGSEQGVVFRKNRLDHLRGDRGRREG